MWVEYEKRGRLRHVGHLDLMRAVQRALRRSGLPVAYSQGFNPHMLLSFAAPLAVGVEGLHEVLEVRLERPVLGDDFVNALSAAMPPGLGVLSARPVEDGHGAPMALLAAAEYEYSFYEAREAMLAAVPGYLRQQSIPALQRSKKGEKLLDLRPLIINLLVKEGRLRAVLALREEGTLRPDLLLSSLAAFAGFAPPRCRVCRTRLYTRDFLPLEQA